MPTPEDSAQRGHSARRKDNILPLDSATWSRILELVRKENPGLVRNWFDTMEPRPLTNGVIQVKVSTIAQLNFCQTQCQQAFTAAAQAVTGRLVMVSFHCDRLAGGGVFTDTDQLMQLNPDYTFDNFVKGPCNELAHAACVAVAGNPGKAGYNPLFIHGGVGLGKTHLLQAVCQQVIEKQPQARILFLSCDSFINQFISAVENSEMSQFRHRYRGVDMLVIDDIHFLAGKDRTQDEFFHTFNTLHDMHKQIILSADCPPSEIPELEERLVSRFNSGLVARIDKPGYETRVAILQKKARLRNLAISDEVLRYVARVIDSNTRELEGALTRMQGMAAISGGTIDMDLARAALGDVAVPKRTTVQRIIEVITGYYGVKPADIQSKKRFRSIAFPRQVGMYLARKHTHCSLEEIGGYFGGRDHSTVLHAIRAVEDMLATDQNTARQIADLENRLTQ